METNPYAPPKAAVIEAAAEEGELIPEGRKVSTGRGKAWIGEGWALFKQAPGTWILIFIVFMLLTLVLMVIPGGSLVYYLVLPIFLAGLMLGCRDIEAGQPLTVGHLFAAFKLNVGNLILVGLLYLAGTLVLTFIAFVPIGVVAAFVIPGLMDGTAGTAPDPDTVMWTFIPLIVLGVLIAFAVSIPLLMALWFAPALVIFHDMAPMESMKASFRGCLKNLMPFLWYGVIGFGLLILALIPVGLGLLVVSPLFWATMYTGYRDIYLRPT